MKAGVITKVSGPLVLASGMESASIQDICHVGNLKLIGEILEMRGGVASIQVYEETTGIGPGEPVVSTGEALSVELGPGLISVMFDGIQRPLKQFLDETNSNFLVRGVHMVPLNRKNLWNFEPKVKIGDEVFTGDIIGTVEESKVITHKIMIPLGLKGTIKEIKSGEHTIDEVICVINTDDGDKSLTMIQKWPVRKGRPVVEKINPIEPMITGQRVIDTFFPIAKGGAAAVPGPFGAGKTVVQHQIAKWSNVDLVVYVGCGERGNEMTDVIKEFPQLIDPNTGESLMERTVLIANTSNMPVAAREASIYTGITIAEYYRDMGYTVAIMADSTSRWAEALREMSGRLEEMPGDEGYPAYLGSRIAEYYERSGRAIVFGQDKREGSITSIGAVSPPGGDTSEPVTQNTLRIVKAFWGLDSSLAGRRHFPAIDWLTSYSLYSSVVGSYLDNFLKTDWSGMTKDAMRLLKEEAGLQEIVRLVGIDSLSEKDRLVLEVTKSIREDYLQQNAFDSADSYTSLAKQRKMLDLIMTFSSEAEKLLSLGVYLNEIIKGTVDVRDKIAKSKYVDEKEISSLDTIKEELLSTLNKILKEDEGGESTNAN